MNARRVFRWLWASLGTLALATEIAACSLNPQPLPPLTKGSGDSDAGSAEPPGGSDGGVDIYPDAGAGLPDAGTVVSPGSDAGAALDGGGFSSDGAINPSDAGISGPGDAGGTSFDAGAGDAANPSDATPSSDATDAMAGAAGDGPSPPTTDSEADDASSDAPEAEATPEEKN